MTIALPSRSHAALALTLVMATVLILLALAGQAMAKGSKSACLLSHGAHHKGGAHACAQGRHRAGSRPKAKGYHAKALGKHARHALGRTGAESTIAHLPTAPLAAAACEDGSDPVAAGAGSYSCEDGSEPACRGGASLSFSSDGSSSTFACDVGEKSGPDPGEAACEGAGSPVQASDGSSPCEESAEPVCEAGSLLAFSADGSTLVCDVSSGEESAD